MKLEVLANGYSQMNQSKRMKFNDCKMKNNQRFFEQKNNLKKFKSWGKKMEEYRNEFNFYPDNKRFTAHDIPKLQKSEDEKYGKFNFSEKIIRSVNSSFKSNIKHF